MPKLYEISKVDCQFTGSHLVCQRLKDPPEELASKMQLLLGADSKIGPAIWKAVVLPAALIVIGQQLSPKKETA